MSTMVVRTVVVLVVLCTVVCHIDVVIDTYRTLLVHCLILYPVLSLAAVVSSTYMLFIYDSIV